MGKRTKAALAISGMFFLAGCAKVDVVESYQIEAGAEMPSDVTEYATLPEGVDSDALSLDIEAVDTSRPGEYQASVTYKNKEYVFTVQVTDTTAPLAELAESYTVTRPETLTASDYVTDIEDATGISVGFLTFEKRDELTVMTDDELEEHALDAVENLVFTEKMAFDETIEASEEGIYDSQIAVRDEAGNMIVFSYTFYVDGTPPVIHGLEDGEMKAVETEEGYDFGIDMTVTDNLDGDMTYAETTIAEMNDYGDYIDMTVTATDRAGNEVSGQAKLTYPEDVMEQIYAQQAEEFEKLLQEITAQAQTDSASVQTAEPSSAAEGLDRALAEEAFALVNQQRVDNGLSALTWDESIYELACTRAQEIVSKYAHERPDGTQLAQTHTLGENLNRGSGASAQACVESWMNSEGHRMNMMMSYTRGVMACYVSGGKSYWVNLFGY